MFKAIVLGLGMAAAMAMGCGGSSGQGQTSTSNGGAGAGPDGGSCSSCGRDWAQFPPIVEVDGAPELWVLSDVHADYADYVTLLSGAGIVAGAPVVPQHVQWSAGHAVLVVVGDLIDKGPDAPDVVRLTAALATAAAAAGGRVVVTMGNHEAEFLADPENSKATGSHGIDPELTAIGLTPAETAAGGDDIGLFLRDLPFAARVDDWFFVHAGDTGGQTIAQMSSALQGGVGSAGFGAPVLSATTSMLEARLSGSGPQWWDTTSDPEGLLGQWTTALGVQHLVMGHQPGAVGFADGTTRAADQMYAAYGGLLFLIDTGLSVDVDDTGGAMLHVVSPGSAGESWSEVLPDGTVKAL
jgi:hypothetical protein